MSEREINLLIENVQSIQKKIDKLETAPALNGGFVKLMSSVDRINEKQTETNDKIEKLHNALYEPASGFFARVKTIEDNTHQIELKQIEHQKTDESFHKQIMEHVSTEVKAETVSRNLTKIAGTDLEELKSVIKLRTTLKRILWIIVAGLLTEVGRVVFEYFNNHH